MTKHSVGQEEINLLTVPEAAELLRISPAGVRRLMQSGDLKHHKIRGSIRIARKDVAEYLAGTKT